MVEGEAAGWPEYRPLKWKDVWDSRAELMADNQHVNEVNVETLQP